MNSYVVYGQDGEGLSEEIMDFFALAPEDYRYDKGNKRYVYDFTGFVFKDKRILAVFPKHYFHAADLEAYNRTDDFREEDVRLLYRAIMKYSSQEGKKAKADSYMGHENNFYSDYPFHAFYGVYQYYRKYGLYQEQEELIKPGFSGKVSWKKTIQKAQLLISDGNLIYSPLYIKKKNTYASFITDCMAYIIDDTIRFFSCFLSLPGTGYQTGGFPYLDHIEFTVRRLHEIKRSVYKDSSKELLDHMISFFEEYPVKSTGGSLHVKVNYFNLVWEEAVNEYLNTYFKGFDPKTNRILFDPAQKRSVVEFQNVRYLIDRSSNQFEIELDHYGADGNTVYIFDSKYYQDLKNLNYKQYAYNEMLRYAMPGISALYSALILPGSKPSGVHFELEGKYRGTRTYGNTITEQYLCVKDVLIHYVES